MIDQHRMVLGLVQSEVDSGEVHALTLKTLLRPTNIPKGNSHGTSSSFPKSRRSRRRLRVVIFIERHSQLSTQCGFPARAVQVLKAAGVRRTFRALTSWLTRTLWEALEEFTKWPTVPQIFIKGQFIGGCDIVSEMFERGEHFKKLIEGA